MIILNKFRVGLSKGFYYSGTKLYHAKLTNIIEDGYHRANYIFMDKENHVVIFSHNPSIQTNLLVINNCFIIEADLIARLIRKVIYCTTTKTKLNYGSDI